MKSVPIKLIKGLLPAPCSVHVQLAGRGPPHGHPCKIHRTIFLDLCGRGCEVYLEPLFVHNPSFNLGADVRTCFGLGFHHLLAIDHYQLAVVILCGIRGEHQNTRYYHVAIGIYGGLRAINKLPDSNVTRRVQ